MNNVLTYPSFSHFKEFRKITDFLEHFRDKDRYASTCGGLREMALQMVAYGNTADYQKWHITNLQQFYNLKWVFQFHSHATFSRGGSAEEILVAVP